MRKLSALLALCAASAFAQLPAFNDRGVTMGHLHILVSDPAPHMQLFSSILGAEPAQLGSLNLLRLPGVIVIVGRTRQAPTGGSNGSTVNRFALKVKSYADTKAKIAAAQGVTIVNDNPGAKQLTVDFPDQVRIELTEDSSLKTTAAMQAIRFSSAAPEKIREWYATTFGVVPGGDLDFKKADQQPAPTKGRSLDHIGFEIKNLDEFVKKLQAAGVTMDGAPGSAPQMGLSWAFIIDPDGTRIELTQGLMGK